MGGAQAGVLPAPDQALLSSCRVKSIDMLACGSQQAHTSPLPWTCIEKGLLEPSWCSLAQAQALPAGVAAAQYAAAVASLNPGQNPSSSPSNVAAQAGLAQYAAALQAQQRQLQAAQLVAQQQVRHTRCGAFLESNALVTTQQQPWRCRAGAAVPPPDRAAGCLGAGVYLLMLGPETLHHPPPQPQRIAEAQHEPVKQQVR